MKKGNIGCVCVVRLASGRAQPIGQPGKAGQSVAQAQRGGEQSRRHHCGVSHGIASRVQRRVEDKPGSQMENTRVAMIPFRC
eukprot:873958-Pyramimonas_sp.AAC.1